MAAAPAARQAVGTRALPLAVRRFLHTETSGGVVLVLAASVALVWANSPWSASYDDVWHTRVTLQVGSVGVDEVNAVIAWLADLTREHVLPQKLLMIHQFRLAMVRGRERLDTSRDELAVVLHADGFGTPHRKLETWQVLHQDAPPNIRWGWKNFYDEDSPTFTPAQTMQIGPEAPVVVTYQ
jgi:hypothetical protein